ncbi:MAG: hypothetical protein P4L27_13955 [Ignavibacteriaceae bacterium]|nr:hypothetical protein [Ignavibacteriaceae bacterium]
MKPVYALKDQGDMTRKIMLDMAYLAEHNKIRFYKYLYEDGLYFLYFGDKKDPGRIEKYFLTRDKIKKEDESYMFFELPSGFIIQ